MESGEALRPNIRIEIRNNLVESMDVDEDNKQSDGEDGEILDCTELSIVNEDINIVPRPYPTANRVWQNDVAEFNEADPEKLSERAKRFALNTPNEMIKLTDEQLEDLCNSLGINKEEENVKFRSLVMHGVDKMSPDDISEYFGKYAPLGMEWITENSCNIVWKDKDMSSKALYDLSQSVKGMPVAGEESAEINKDEGRSILLKNKNREIEMQDDDEETNKENGPKVNLSDILIPIPPGSWRLGLPHPNSKCILLRFTLKTDKKPKALSEFSKMRGNMRATISEAAKLGFRGIFDRNRMHDTAEEDDSKNPWGSLAKHWNQDIQFAEKEPIREMTVSLNASKLSSSALQNRLGFKRAHESEEKEKEEEPTSAAVKTKAPRMRMYADEEEAKIKRKRQLQAQKPVVKEEEDDSADDLRQRLPSRRRPDLSPVPIPIETYTNQVQGAGVTDLGSKLKNRSMKQAMQLRNNPSVVQQNAREILTAKRQRSEDYRRHERKDVRSILNARNERMAQNDARDKLRNDKNSLSNRFTNNNHRVQEDRLAMTKQDRLGALVSNDIRSSNRMSSMEDRLNTRISKDDRVSSKDDRFAHRSYLTSKDRYDSRMSHKDNRVELHSRSSRGDRLNDRRNKSPQRRDQGSRYGNRMRSDNYQSRRQEDTSYSDYEEDLDEFRTNSKVNVVIKKTKAPAVASTIWSRINETERLKTVSEGKLRVRKDSTSSSSSNSTSSSSSSSSSSEGESSDSQEIVIDNNKKSGFQRPGFKNHIQKKLGFKATDHKSPLRIEINNDHFRK